MKTLILLGSDPSIATENEVCKHSIQYKHSLYTFIPQLERQPIHYACEGGHLSLVSQLIEQHGVDPNALDSVNISRLHIFFSSQSFSS